jgi:hypothetical protein
MKSLGRWIKKWREVLICLVLFFIFAAPVLIIKGIGISDKIQAMAIIGLIFITAFYAIQTQKLVEEERKKRYAEFGMQRIQKFLRPLLKRLDSFKDSVSQIAEASKYPLLNNFENSLGIFRAQLNETKEFFIEYLFMTNPIIRYGYLKITKMTILKSIENRSEEFVTYWTEKIDEYIGELETEVNNEISRICKNIRKTYGFFSQKTEILPSSDDLTVLSDRPPTRI